MCIYFFKAIFFPQYIEKSLYDKIKNRAKKEANFRPVEFAFGILRNSLCPISEMHKFCLFHQMIDALEILEEECNI